MSNYDLVKGGKNEVHESVNLLKNPYTVITVALNGMKWNSKNTFINYSNVIDEWFSVAFGIKLPEITKDMVESINPIMVEGYINHLREKGNGNSTINQKLSRLKQMARWLETSGFDIRENVFRPFTKIKDNNKNSYEAFTEDEMNAMIKKSSDYKHGERKSLLLRFAYDTAFRKNALLSIKRESFIIKDNGTHWVWVYDKGNKKDTKAISTSLYNKALSMMGKTPKSLLFYSPTDKSKPMTSRSVDRLLDQLKKDLNIRDKNKVFHSIKKTSVQRMGRWCNYEPNIMKKHANHSSFATTMNYYSNRTNMDIIMSEMAENMSGTDINTGIVQKSNRKEIIDAIINSSPLVRAEIVAILKKNKNKKINKGN